MSSRPSPIPRIRPRTRKPTVVAKTIHNTEMAMRESRALPVMGMGSVLMNGMIAGRQQEEGNAKIVEVMRASSRSPVVLSESHAHLHLTPHVSLALLRLFYCCDSCRTTGLSTPPLVTARTDAVTDLRKQVESGGSAIQNCSALHFLPLWAHGISSCSF